MTTAEELINLYDKENNELKQRIVDLNNKIAILENSNTEIYGDEGLIAPGNEKELYPGETKELLIDILKDARKNIKDKTRRADILDDLIKNNPVKEIPLNQSKKVKEALKGYSIANKALLKRLKELGLSAVKGNTHYKITYHGDARYVTYLASTGSDKNCGGQNLAHEIVSKCF